MGITIITKKSSLMGELIIKEIDYQIAKEITITNHYSKKWNTSFGKINFGIFKGDRLLGVAVYGNLMNPNSYSKWSQKASATSSSSIPTLAAS